MTEAELRRLVQQECARLGLLTHYCPDSRRCEGPRGMPDLIIAGRRGILFAELKGPDGDTSADQDAWLYMLHLGGVPYVVRRPEDWDSRTIQARLRELAG